jgi:hypothetical protein
MGLRGRARWGRIKAPPDLQVEPDEAVRVGPNEAVIAIWSPEVGDRWAITALRSGG